MGRCYKITVNIKVGREAFPHNVPPYLKIIIITLQGKYLVCLIYNSLSICSTFWDNNAILKNRSQYIAVTAKGRDIIYCR